MSDGPARAAQFRMDIASLQSSVADANSAYLKSSLLRSTRDDVIELALVRALGLFEEFVGDLFFLALQGRLGQEVVPIMAANTDQEASLIVAGVDASADSRYVNWLPFKERVMPRAKRLLVSAQPFGRLAYRTSERNSLGELALVRNRIAHDSPVARRKFEDLARSKGYPSARAADYLGSTRGVDAEISLALVQLQLIADGLAAPSEAGSRTYLSSEGPFSADMTAPPGDYECVRNNHATSLSDYGHLGNCRDCPRPQACANCGQRPKAESTWTRLA